MNSTHTLNYPLLEMLISFAADELESSITVFVKGLIISGILISRRTYIKEVANAIRNGIGNMNKELANTPCSPSLSCGPLRMLLIAPDKSLIYEC